MRDEQKRKKIKFLLITAGLIMAVIFLIFAGFEIIKRSKITIFEVKTNSLTCTDKDQINQFLQGININYFSFKEDEFGRNLKKKFFCIGKIQTRLSYPNKLVIETWGREPIFSVREVSTSLNLNPVVNLSEVPIEATESTKEAVPVKTLNQILSDLKPSSESASFLVDREGVIFEQTLGTDNFPVLSVLGFKLVIGTGIPGGVIEKAEMIYNNLKEIGVPTDNIIVIGDRLIIDSKPRVIFSLKKRIDYQTASLQLILAQAKMNSDPQITDQNSIESIDLRFDKPVVVYGR